jgi:hypothetical protein
MLGVILIFSQVLTAAQERATGAPKRVVIPFDFESKFDHGDYGQTLGEMFWTKLRRRGGFVLPESLQDVREGCQRAGMTPGPDTPLARVKEIVTRGQAGDIGIWGKVERVAGFETDVYDLWIAVADFSVDPPRMIYQKQARTQTVSEIPHVYVQQALDALYGRAEAVVPAPDPQLRGRGNPAPNLVRGDFELGRAAPLGWAPLPDHVTWVREAAQGASSKNRVIRFTLDEDLAGTTGLLYYSDFFPIEGGARYRFQCRWKTTGSAAKVFIKCYDNLPNEFRGHPGADPGRTARREVYRSQQNLQGKSGAWNAHTGDFTPQHARFHPRWGRVMLYAYWPAGTVEWDDVVVQQVVPAPAGRGARNRP